RAALRAQLASSEPKQRAAAMEALSLAGTARAAPLLYDALAGAPALRVEAARALRALGLPDAAPRVRAALGDSGQRLRVELAACLVALGERDGVAILGGALADEPAAQLIAAVALAAAGRGERAEPVLRQVYGETPRGRERWREAARGLLALGDAGAR